MAALRRCDGRSDSNTQSEKISDSHCGIQELRFAPLVLAYLGLAQQAWDAGLDPSRNLWNAVFDFSSPGDCKKNWSLAPLSECGQYHIAVDDGGRKGTDILSSSEAAVHDNLSPEDGSIFPSPTREVLQAPPLPSGHDPGRLIGW